MSRRGNPARTRGVRCTRCSADRWAQRADSGTFRCLECERLRNRRYRRRPHAKARDRQLKLQARYGITVEQYEIMFVRQQGCCAICQQPSTTRLVVDHDHEGGAVRGLLCQRCNKGLGLFDDDAARLRAASYYLKEGFREPYSWKSVLKF